METQDSVDPACRAVLHAALFGRRAVLQELLEGDTTLAQASSASDDPPLPQAAMNGHPEVIRYLRDKGADVNRSQGPTALAQACTFRHTPVVELLLEHDADVTIEDADGLTPLMRSVSRGYAEGVEALLAHGGCPLDHRNGTGRTAAFMAAERGDVETLRLLLEACADASVPNAWPTTPLQIAVHVKSQCCTELLRVSRHAWCLFGSIKGGSMLMKCLALQKGCVTEMPTRQRRSKTKDRGSLSYLCGRCNKAGYQASLLQRSCQWKPVTGSVGF
jgi:ankyrin repeat protein